MMQNMKSRTDAKIHHDVLQELLWDTCIHETEVGVQVDQSVVTLTGVVGSYAKKRAAEEAAHRVAGVLDVADEIQVNDPDGPFRSDTQVAQAIRHALEWNALARQEGIETTVEAGWVTLEGTSPYLADSQYAEHVVSSLAGVKGVTNNIQVPPIEGNPEEIRRSIEEALERWAERQFRRIRHEADDIQVQVRAGLVSLSGEVQTWREKQAILGAAGHARGIYAVEDHLLIKRPL